MVSTYRVCRTISVTSLIGARLLMDTVAWFYRPSEEIDFVLVEGWFVEVSR
jgi:hypothetical protein